MVPEKQVANRKSIPVLALWGGVFFAIGGAIGAFLWIPFIMTGIVGGASLGAALGYWRKERPRKKIERAGYEDVPYANGRLTALLQCASLTTQSDEKCRKKYNNLYK